MYAAASYSYAELVIIILNFIPGYLLLGMLSSLVFRAVRDALPENPAAQERIIGASLFAMAVADVRISACILRAGTYSSSTIRLPSKLKVSLYSVI